MDGANFIRWSWILMLVIIIMILSLMAYWIVGIGCFYEVRENANYEVILELSRMYTLCPVDPDVGVGFYRCPETGVEINRSGVFEHAPIMRQVVTTSLDTRSVEERLREEAMKYAKKD